jgi:hypothetical protein
VGIKSQERSVILLLDTCYLALLPATLALPDRNDGQQGFSAACKSRPYRSRCKAAPTIFDPRESALIRGRAIRSLGEGWLKKSEPAHILQKIAIDWQRP